MDTQKKPAGLRKKEGAALLAVFALLFGMTFAGCGGDDDDPPAPPPPEERLPAPSGASDLAGKTVYEDTYSRIVFADSTYTKEQLVSGVI